MNSIAPTKSRIYTISGLGADERVFKNLESTEYELIHLAWQNPLPHENLKAYARRIAAEIPDEKPILMGLSFGGLLAQELAQLLNARGLILISSFTRPSELPSFYRFASKAKLYKLLPASLMPYFGKINNYLFGIKKAKDKALLADIIRKTDPKFVKWAVNELMQFKGIDNPTYSLLRFHGDKDRLIPYRGEELILIKNAGHFMVHLQANQLKPLITDFLKT
ncbi:MAG: alpha/beta hydrolase [Bacteroidetes bacterium]|nr:MAG: alpha/beta hydrolase [Bacteroidota bacterium]